MMLNEFCMLNVFYCNVLFYYFTIWSLGTCQCKHTVERARGFTQGGYLSVSTTVLLGSSDGSVVTEHKTQVSRENLCQTVYIQCICVS